MTAVAAAITDDGVVMAAESQLTRGFRKNFHATPKVWASEPYAFGACGCVRVMQVVRHYASWPKFRLDEDTDLERFAVKGIVPAIRTAARENGALQTDSGLEKVDVSLLAVVNVHHQIMQIHSNGAVIIEPNGRAAIGSGYAEALGWLGDKGPWTETDVIEAVRRATISDLGCSGPITVMNCRTLQIRTVPEEGGRS